MKTSLSWLREYVELPAGITASELDTALTNLGMEVEVDVSVEAEAGAQPARLLRVAQGR